MADPAALWGLAGAVGGVVLAKALDYLTDRGKEDRGQLRRAIDQLDVKVDDLTDSVADTREKVAGIAAVVNGLVVAPLDTRPRRPR